MSDEGFPEGDIDLGTYVPTDVHQRVAAKLLAIVAQRDGEIERLTKRVADMTRALDAAKEFMNSGVGKSGEPVPPWCTRSHTKLKEALAALASSDGK